MTLIGFLVLVEIKPKMVGKNIRRINKWQWFQMC